MEDNNNEFSTELDPAVIKIRDQIIKKIGDKPLEEVKLQVTSDFNAKQDEFIQLVNHNKPTPIEFSDKEDIPINKNDMNNMLNNMKSMRENVYGQVTSELYVDSNNNSITSDKQNITETMKSDINNNTNNSRVNSHNGSCQDYIWSSFGKSNQDNDSNDDDDDSLKKNVKLTHNDFVSKLKTINTQITDNNNSDNNNSNSRNTSINFDLNQKLLDNQNYIIKKLDLIFDKLREKES